MPRSCFDLNCAKFKRVCFALKLTERQDEVGEIGIAGVNVDCVNTLARRKKRHCGCPLLVGHWAVAPQIGKGAVQRAQTWSRIRHHCNDSVPDVSVAAKAFGWSNRPHNGRKEFWFVESEIAVSVIVGKIQHQSCMVVDIGVVGFTPCISTASQMIKRGFSVHIHVF